MRGVLWNNYSEVTILTTRTFLPHNFSPFFFFFFNNVRHYNVNLSKDQEIDETKKKSTLKTLKKEKKRE